MENNRLETDIEISLNHTEGGLYFRMKDGEGVNQAIHEALRAEYFGIRPNTMVVYPENAIIDSDRIFLETTSKVL